MDNSVAADVLHSNANLWESVRGPAPEALLRPTPRALLDATRAADELEHLLRSEQERPEGFDEFAKQCVEAARALRILDWSAIHAEKYSITPEAVFLGMVQNAESLMRKQADEERRRLAWLREEVADTNEAVPLREPKGDAYKCNPDQFMGKPGRLPQVWKRQCRPPRGSTLTRCEPFWNSITAF